MLVPHSRPRRLTLVLTLLVAAAALALPAVASAAKTFEVTSVGTSAGTTLGNRVCDTASEGCTLRAAIEEANGDGNAEEDFITFNAGLFNGGATDVIPTTGLPAITGQVSIVGESAPGGCSTAAGVKGPCVELNGTAGLVINNTGEVTVRGVAFTGAVTAISLNNSDEFVLFNSWLGVKLSGAIGANVTGLQIDPKSDDARIGGVAEPGELLRNVFANHTGLAFDVMGADDTKIQGNYFGVAPDGTTAAANVQNLEVTSIDSDPTDFIATGTLIGANVGESDPGPVTTAACDGGCNVFADVVGSGFSGNIDLGAESGQNELPLGGGAGGTAIQGNYIGLDATGAASSDESVVGILAVDAGDVLIGGGEPGEANHVNRSGYGIYAEDAPNMEIANNRFGLNPAGTALLGPTAVAVFVFTESIPPGTNATVVENRIASGESGIGIEIQGAGAFVTKNVIGLGVGGQQLGAGGIGIYAWGNLGGSVIEGNTVVDASQVGILLKSDGNTVAGNRIEDSAEAGIRVQATLVSVTGNEVGGDADGSENEIFGSGDAAIEVVGDQLTEAIVRRNVGAGNGDVFIDIGGNGSGNLLTGPNGGIQAPSIDATTAASASGSAEPNATIRVFRKATAGTGEIQSFLGEAEADGSGKWTVNFAQVPGQTNIAATQTGATGTSELALAVTPADPENKGSGNGSGGPGAGNPDRKAPETTIAKKPKPNPDSTTQKFKFSSSEKNSRFECKLDKGKFKKCRSPKTYKKLKPGKHVFKVRAVDAAGNVDPTPAKKKFKINP